MKAMRGMSTLGTLFKTPSGSATGAKPDAGTAMNGKKSNITVDAQGNLIAYGDTFIGNVGSSTVGSGKGGSGGGKKPDKKPDKKKIIAGGFADDGAKGMPSAAGSLANIRRLQQAIIARSGRTSTDLTGGSRSFVGALAGRK